ncbi:hypothetical protein H6G80_00495 [Nostoc sp. FACHB-87]|uniref:hypothetical protein n=1 Tax=Nostocales TaxID=1161 RepID=UPI0016854072|nr:MULTISPECIES: hypothetical protein [Nostocales]MBD2301032.1 hypothetical protein [Nostoc sp. FACHB-190]MBD2452581.1 hypothetical protein [Nostoc sp. FACHB-87]MBD2473512.1 hypothetical protein [Anabaena sp. FACHB-83]MBD2486177.1 hypothetical protein [Aulosira sp. FACHB-615]
MTQVCHQNVISISQTEFIQIKQGVSVTRRDFRLFYCRCVLAIAFLPKHHHTSKLISDN